MVYVPPYNPERYKRANRYLASGRLRPLKEVMLISRRLSLITKITSRRPRGQSNWRPYHGTRLYRSGYQERQWSGMSAAYLKSLRENWEAEKSSHIHRY